MFRRSNAKGFSLLEMIIALAIIGAALTSMIGIQTSSTKISHQTKDSIRMIWAMRSTLEQLRYRLDVLGLKALRANQTFQSKELPDFSFTIVKDIRKNFKISRFLESFLKLMPDQDSEEIAQIMNFGGNQLETKVDHEEIAIIKVTVSWKQDNKARTFETSFPYFGDGAMK